jgi:hypothetical protein
MRCIYLNFHPHLVHALSLSQLGMGKAVRRSANNNEQLSNRLASAILIDDICHVFMDVEERLYRQGQRTTNTRPFPNYPSYS